MISRISVACNANEMMSKELLTLIYLKQPFYKILYLALYKVFYTIIGNKTILGLNTEVSFFINVCNCTLNQRIVKGIFYDIQTEYKLKTCIYYL